MLKGTPCGGGDGNGVGCGDYCVGHHVSDCCVYFDRWFGYFLMQDRVVMKNQKWC